MTHTARTGAVVLVAAAALAVAALGVLSWRSVTVVKTDTSAALTNFEDAKRRALRDTGFDLDAFNLTATDLERAGARVILDETWSSGDRLLVWTEE